MQNSSARLELLIELSRIYERDLTAFVIVPPLMMQMSRTRTALAELRNDGYVEEQARGVVRLRPQGYVMVQKQRLFQWVSDNDF